MGEDFAEHLVHLSYGALGLHRASKLGLDHAHGGLHVAALVVVRQERLAVVVVKVPRVVPDVIEPRLIRLDASRVTVLEGDVGSCAYRFDCSQVSLACVGFVRAHFTNGEGLGSSAQE